MEAKFGHKLFFRLFPFVIYFFIELLQQNTCLSTLPEQVHYLTTNVCSIVCLFALDQIRRSSICDKITPSDITL